MTARSNRREVRNPLITLPGALKLRALPRPVREGLAEVLREIAADSQGRAEKCWRTHKAPMAAYWKAVAVYARHLARVIEEPERRRAA